MISEPKTLRNRAVTALTGLAAGIALLAGAARAEDPLLGRIKLIKCVGCDPGAVNLILHDPIDVRDFEVQIKEADYQKIVTPLAGKTVYDKEGCFYWMDLPKPAPKDASIKDASTKDGSIKDGPKDGSVKDGSAKDRNLKDGSDRKSAKNTPAPDSAATGIDGMLETSAPPPAPAIEGKPSRCIPFVRVEVKSTHPKGRKDDE
jgi:hypothetical protein